MPARHPKELWVQVQMVRRPSGDQTAVEAWGLDVTLVDRLGLELPLDDDVGLGEPLLDVAQLVLNVAGDVALDPGVLAPGEAGHPEVGGHLVVEDGSVVIQSVVQGQHRGQHFVVHFDELGRLVRHVGVDGGHRRDGVALVEDLFPGHDVLGHHSGIGHKLGEVYGAGIDQGEVQRRGNRGHPG